MNARRDLLLAILTVVLVAAVALRYPDFARPAGLVDTFDDSSILILLALGQMLVLLTRCVDLSVAATVALTGMVAALLNQAQPELPVAAIALISSALGAALGAFNGLLVWKLAIPSIVVTLGTMAIYRGLVHVVSGGRWVTSNAMSESFQRGVSAEVLGLSVLSWLAVLLTCAAALLLTRTRTGRQLYLAGGNPEAAAYIGIDAGRSQCVAFVISGAVAGLCGYLWVARYAVADTAVASGFELQVIAACVIGGVSIAGGVGRVLGVLLGCLFLGVIKSALPLIGASPFWQTAISGAVIVIAVVVNARSSGNARRRILVSS